MQRFSLGAKSEQRYAPGNRSLQVAPAGGEVPSREKTHFRTILAASCL
jgi:hypothetical protein